MMSDKAVFRIIAGLSLVVFLVVLILYIFPQKAAIPYWAQQLPLLNACINGTCSLLLITSLWCIKNKRVQWHKRINLTTFALSSLFLISYIIFHSFEVETRYPANDPLRPVYLAILLTHILLATVVLPLILVSFYFGLSGQIEKHRKVSKFSYPIWLYVTVSGVVVYLMISPYYQFG